MLIMAVKAPFYRLQFGEDLQKHPPARVQEPRRPSTRYTRGAPGVAVAIGGCKVASVHGGASTKMHKTQTCQEV